MITLSRVGLYDVGLIMTGLNCEALYDVKLSTQCRAV